jgi:CAAX prenyl protease-like protein
VWLALDRFAGPRPDNGIAAGLLSLPVLARVVWLVFRTVGAVVTVPIAEELAFRGYLLRRLVSSDFTSVSFERFDLWPVLVSSIAFGILHGDRLLAGIIAGLAYAAITRWRGRISDAVLAHATTNALIAASVLLAGEWQLW